MRVELDVVRLYAVSDKNNPTQIAILELHANVKAYNAHPETPHFNNKDKTIIEMIRSVELAETDRTVPGAAGR